MDLLIQSFEGELPITVSDLDQYLGMQCTHDQEAGVITVNNNELILKTAVLLGLDPEHSNGVNLPFEAGVRLSKDDCPQTSADKADQTDTGCRSSMGSSNDRLLIQGTDCVFRLEDYRNQ